MSRAEDIVSTLNATECKSDIPTEFEVALRDAFDFLGFNAELIGGSGDSDVLLSANIGLASFKVSVDGKTSKDGKVIDRQIDWISLDDHVKKNKADYSMVVGPDFAGGNLPNRARVQKVSILRTNQLIKLIQAHAAYPFTLLELKDLFTGYGDINTQVEDLLSQNQSRRSLLDQFRALLPEMRAIQDRLGYFTADGLAIRDRVVELEIEPKDIPYIINLLSLPFIKAIHEVSPGSGKYIFTMQTKDTGSLFHHIADLLSKDDDSQVRPVVPVVIITPPKGGDEQAENVATKYFQWFVKENSVIALGNKSNPYQHYCPTEHFIKIVRLIAAAYQSQNVISVDTIFSQLEGKDLVPNRPFKGKAEDYKIRMAFGILELEKLIKWTSSKRPVEYVLQVPAAQIITWLESKIVKKSG